jgi:hypothetical protein
MCAHEFVAHCHTLDHEDLGMMQRMDILPAPGEPSGCTEDHASVREMLLAGNFPICSARR